MEDLAYRSVFLYGVMDDFVTDLDSSILEIGEGDGRNTDFLRDMGYTDVTGIDKLQGTPIEDVEEKAYDVVYSMSTLFLIPPENDWVFEKIARMAKKYIITLEGETTHAGAFNPDGGGVYGRDYNTVFKPFGFRQMKTLSGVFNKYGVLRVLKNEKSN